jgi:hypothetical protein
MFSFNLSFEIKKYGKLFYILFFENANWVRWITLTMTIL